MGLLNPREQALRPTLLKVQPKPTLVVGLGTPAVSVTRAAAQVCALPAVIAVDAPILSAWNSITIGAVSGTDDLSFVDSDLVRRLNIAPEQLQALAQAARLTALREAKGISQCGQRTVAATLEQHTILVVSEQPADPPSRFQLALLRSRNPLGIVLLTRWPEACGALRDEGLIQGVVERRGILGEVPPT